MKPVLLWTPLVLAAVACTSEDSPTQPGTPGEPSLAAAAAAAIGWSTRAAFPGLDLKEGAVAMAPNAAGQSIVYYLGGYDRRAEGKPVKAYNVATNTWTLKAATIKVWGSNGAAKIGSRIYFSGGRAHDDDFRHEIWMTSQLWAYDYTSDRVIERAGMPIINGQGVTGVIGDKLYVLPGACSTLSFPDPGYCSQPRTRRFFRYDPGANRWVSRPWAPHNHLLGAAGVIQGKLYVVGGDATAALDMYDPVTNKWTTLAPIPTAGPAIGAVLAGKFFVIVGNSDGDLRSYEYTPRTNVWRARPAPAFAHDGVVRVTLDGRIHLLAVGRSALVTPNPSELYTR